MRFCVCSRGRLAPVTPTFSDLAEAQYLLLTTFTKDGRPKPVPIWAALTLTAGIDCWSSPRRNRGRSSGSATRRG